MERPGCRHSDKQQQLREEARSLRVSCWRKLGGQEKKSYLETERKGNSSDIVAESLATSRPVVTWKIENILNEF